MNAPEKLKIELLSDTTFGRGDGTAGEVDVEIEHDELGRPYIGGKALHGLIREAWLSMRACFGSLEPAGEKLLGLEADVDEGGILRIGRACLADEEASRWIASAVERESRPIPAGEILRALTDIRRQTAEDRDTGAPARTTLRASRVALRGLCFAAPLTWLGMPDAADLECLELCVRGVRHAGLGRHRGRGHVRLSLEPVSAADPSEGSA